MSWQQNFMVLLKNIWPTVYRIVNGTFFFFFFLIKKIFFIAWQQIRGK